MLILALLGLFFPRILIIVLYFFTDWFQGIHDNILLPLLGFIFAPFALLWYTFVMSFMDGEWGIISIAGMVIAIALDFGAFRSSSSLRRR